MNNLIKRSKQGIVGLCGAAALAMGLMVDIQPAAAHGERSQEPFLRMRTIQWYDMKWGPETTKVNDFAAMTGKFHLAEDWPRAVGKPGRAFFNVGSPSPVFVRLSTKLNGEPTYISGPLEIGRDYAFEAKLKARIPGRHHMHAMVNIKDAGPIAGPAAWMNITGSWDDFTNPVKLLTGETIDTETFNYSNGMFWHILWLGLGIFWIGYYVARPMFLPRSRVLLAYGDELLLDPTRVGKMVLERKDGGHVTLARGEQGAWTVDGVDGKPNLASIPRFLDDLHDLRGSDIVAEPATALAQYGLDAPDLRITLIDKDGTEMGTVLGAKREKYYVMRAGGPTVFEARDYMYARLDKQPRDFVQTELKEPAATATTAPPTNEPVIGDEEQPPGEDEQDDEQNDD